VSVLVTCVPGVVCLFGGLVCRAAVCRLCDGNEPQQACGVGALQNAGQPAFPVCPGPWRDSRVSHRLPLPLPSSWRVCWQGRAISMVRRRIRFQTISGRCCSHTPTAWGRRVEAGRHFMHLGPAPCTGALPLGATWGVLALQGRGGARTRPQLGRVLLLNLLAPLVRRPRIGVPQQQELERCIASARIGMGVHTHTYAAQGVLLHR
jgi:hypothetical protein